MFLETKIFEGLKYTCCRSLDLTKVRELCCWDGGQDDKIILIVYNDNDERILKFIDFKHKNKAYDKIIKILKDNGMMIKDEVTEPYDGIFPRYHTGYGVIDWTNL